MKIKSSDLIKLIKHIVYKETLNIEKAEIISKIIVLSELMSSETHGVHYFLRSVYPFLNQGKINYKVSQSIITSENKQTEGIYNTSKIITLASEIAKEKGFSLALIKNPGKVGALRSYCVDIVSQGQTIIILKNTAPSISQNGVRLIRTNHYVLESGVPTLFSI
jgi:LDH2 family malate/lactate/ureidoglycolate dehydrogenase